MIKIDLTAAAPRELGLPSAAANEISGRREAAEQFEEIFLRKMLSSLMNSAKFGGDAGLAGSEMYDSMVVEALADGISNGGGLGIADLLEDQLSEAELALGADDSLASPEVEVGDPAEKSAESMIPSSIERTIRSLPNEAPTIPPTEPRRIR